LGNFNLLCKTGNYDNFTPSQQRRDLTPKEKQMNDETSMAIRNKGIAMMAQGYT